MYVFEDSKEGDGQEAVTEKLTRAMRDERLLDMKPSTHNTDIHHFGQHLRRQTHAPHQRCAEDVLLDKITTDSSLLNRCERSSTDSQSFLITCDESATNQGPGCPTWNRRCPLFSLFFPLNILPILANDLTMSTTLLEHLERNTRTQRATWWVSMKTSNMSCRLVVRARE